MGTQRLPWVLALGIPALRTPGHADPGKQGHLSFRRPNAYFAEFIIMALITFHIAFKSDFKD